MKKLFKFIIRNVLKYPAIILIKYLQWRYKNLSIKYNQVLSNVNLNKLLLIHHILYYFKREFHAWGYFHPDCVWSESDEKFFRKLFPERDFKESDDIIEYKPEAITYYRNVLYGLDRKKNRNYPKEIQAQLKKWGDLN